ncbi:MAG TPA: CBS domain-containing protein [Leucothrix sp.]|nr:CBS domain-containing protein [Leucothrix sp.]
MKVSDVMTTGVKTAHADTPVKDIANTMCLNNISGLPIVDENDTIIGIVSEKDLLRRMFPDMKKIAEEGRPNFEEMEKGYADTLGLVAGDIMTKTVSSVTSDMPIMKAASLMCINNIRRIPVADNNKLVGIVSIGDVHKAIFQSSLG